MSHRHNASRSAKNAAQIHAFTGASCAAQDDQPSGVMSKKDARKAKKAAKKAAASK